MLNSLLAFSVTQKASDLHLSSGEKPCIRVNGDLKRLSEDKLLPQKLKIDLLNILNVEQKAILQQHQHIDFVYHVEDVGRFRVNIFYQQRGISAVFRIIKQQIPSLSEIDAPKVINELAKAESGMILVTGATGSGKSTTLAALIQYINQTQAKHIITLEDPIEFIYQNDKSLIQQRELNYFGNAIDSILRQDPDIILLGELRNRHTIQAALTIAETGHLVLATLHTSSAIQTINRIVDVFDDGSRGLIRSQLSNSLKAIICQKLVPYNESRKAIYEVLINTPAVSNLINEGKTKQILSLMQTGQQYGMQLMTRNL
ncbi:type IV pilus twitching motility protein PilT [Gilliamella apicola]|uniref:type IV pilus twitching motility protein PilT n=1 Tax=Gilliamella apicola TaxID=1196095 RepID=UPI001C6548CF|nr:PilT/PilU family type 4a pilus ATPase [Gilliamella apicola]